MSIINIKVLSFLFSIFLPEKQSDAKKFLPKYFSTIIMVQENYQKNILITGVPGESWCSGYQKKPPSDFCNK